MKQNHLGSPYETPDTENGVDDGDGDVDVDEKIR